MPRELSRSRFRGRILAFSRGTLPGRSHGLVDEFVFQIHPVVLGQGHRLFPTGAPKTKLSLVGSAPSKSGVIVATYRVQR